MLNRSASLAISTSVLKALPGKLDSKRHSPSILYLPPHGQWADLTLQQDAPAHVRNNGGIQEVRLESPYTSYNATIHNSTDCFITFSNFGLACVYVH